MQPTYLTPHSKRKPTSRMSHNTSHNSTITTPITATKANGGNQACAACKYQRRKCAPDCILAPYFPHDRTRQFLNAHRLFGVSNITKIIKNLDPPNKDEAMKTIIFQPDIRAADPVGGCSQIIRDLQCQIEFANAELDLVLHHLAICRAQAVTALQHLLPPLLQPHHHPPFGAHNDSSAPINPDPFDTYNHMGFDHDNQDQHLDEPQQQSVPHDQKEVGNHNFDDHDHLQGEQEEIGEEEKYIVHEEERILELPQQGDIAAVAEAAAWAMQQDLAMSALQNKQSLLNNCIDVKATYFDIGGETLKFKCDVHEDTVEEHSDEATSKEAKPTLKEEVLSPGGTRDHDLNIAAESGVHDLTAAAANFFTLTNFNT